MLPAEIELTPHERDRLLACAASAIRSRNLSTVAVLLLEMHRPIGFISSQALVVFTPFLAPALGLVRVQQITALLADPRNIDRLLALIEEDQAAAEPECAP